MTPAEQELDDLMEPNKRIEFNGGGREIGAEFLVERLMCEEGDRPRKLSLFDVNVVGELDLEAAEIGFPVEFEKCAFDQVPNVEQATLAGLYFVNCALPGLRASQVRLLDGLALHGCQVKGRVQLTGAHVAGQLDMVDCVIVCQSGSALKADGLRVEKDFCCSGRFRVIGRTHMISAYIGGQFDCDGAVFRNPGEEVALELGGLVVREHVFWRNGFSVKGEVNLSGADITGRLICHGARFANPDGTALRAVGMTVRQEVEFSDKCTVIGALNLVGCQIGAWMKFTGGRFRNSGGMAINLARASTKLNVVLRKGTVVRGMLCLAGTRIGGDLGAQGGRFLNKNDTAIEATGLKVHGDLNLAVHDSAGFQAQGRVVLSNADVGGNLDCTGGQFENKDRDALIARGISVARDATLRGPFTACGRVDLAGASVEGKLDFRDARLKNSRDAVRCDRVRVGHAVRFDRSRVRGGVRMCDARIGSDATFSGATVAGETALKLKGTQVRGTLRLCFGKPPSGPIDLRKVTTGAFDDREGDWSTGTKLNEFVYGALHDTAMDLSKRLDWLRDNKVHVPQVYLQLASTCARAGHHGDATKVYMEREDVRRRSRKGRFARSYRMLWWVLKPTVGYGYRPLRILWCFAALQLLGWGLFERLGDGRFPPARPVAQGTQLGYEFNAFLFTFDLMLPVASIKYRDLWAPVGLGAVGAVTFTVLGWVLAICLVTGLGRLFKRDDR